MSDLVVMKFGGTSVADTAAIRRLVRIVARARSVHQSRRSCRPLVVVSALAGVTDQIIMCSRLAEMGDARRAVAGIEELGARHRDLAAVVSDPDNRAGLIEEIDGRLGGLSSLIRAFSVLRDVTPRSLDAAVAAGELLSSRIVAAALLDAGMPAVWFDARTLLVTDAAHSAALPIMAATKTRLETELGGALAANMVAVTAGFIGATDDGVTTTLGRGGSDYSASIFGACLGAREIQIWTDVDGMLSADPRIVASPRLIPALSFAEASELAYFGAKVLHPSTILPAVASEIPVRILNSRRPKAEGTLITASTPARDTPLAAIACKRGVTVIDITSTRMLMAHGFLRQLFEVFERFQTAVDVVTTSEVSVSVTIDDRRQLPALVEALSRFAEVSSESEMALMCAVGENLHADPMVFAQVMRALEGVSLRMVSQAASRRNITFVLREVDLPPALTRLHDRFFASVTGRARAPAPTGSTEVLLGAAPGARTAGPETDA